MEHYLLNTILIEIPKISIHLKNYKLTLKFSSLKIYCELKDIHLTRIDGMKGELVDKGLLMRNCEKVIKEVFENISALKEGKKLIKYYERSPFQRAVKGVITFIIMSLLQLLTIDLDKISFILVENHKNTVIENEIKQETPENYINIIKSQKFIGINVREIVGNFLIDKFEKLSLRVKCRQADLLLKNDTNLDYQKAFQISNTSIQLDAPFGYSLTHCFINSEIYVNVGEITGDYDCHMVPTYRYIKYFEFLQGRIVRYARNKVLNFTRKELPFIPKKIEVVLDKAQISVSKLQDFLDGDGLVGERVSSLEAKVENLSVEILYDLVQDITTQDLKLKIGSLNVDTLFQFQEKIHMLDVEKAQIDLLAKYDLNHAGLLYYGTFINVEDCKVNLHPVFVPLYNAYMNLSLRSYLEYDFDIYSFLLDKYKQNVEKQRFSSDIDKHILAQIIQEGKTDIREYIITPHEIIRLSVKNIEITGPLQKKPQKNLKILSQNLFWEYETFKNPLSKNSKENVKGSNVCSFDSIKFYFVEEREYIQVLQEQEEQEYQKREKNTKIGTISQFSMKVAEEEEYIKSEYTLKKFHFEVDEQQMKHLIYFGNKIDSELLDETKNKMYNNPYTYKNNPYEKTNYSNTNFQNFSVIFSFATSNKILLSCSQLVGSAAGPNVMKMNSDTFFKNISIQIQYMILNEEQTVKIASIQDLQQSFKFGDTNEQLYSVNGFQLNLAQDVNYIGDFFLILQEQIFDIQVHSEEITKKMLKKKKKYIEIQHFKQQLVDNILTFQFKDFKFLLEDSKGDNFLKAFQAFQREYLSKSPEYSERNCILNLQKYKKECETPLLEIMIETLKISAKPLENMDTFDQIEKFLRKVDQKNSKVPLKEEYFKAFRFLQLETELANFSIQMRDYPYKILELQKLASKGQFILSSLKIPQKINPNYLQRLFYYIEFEVGKFDTTAGLCLASGLKEVGQRLLNIFGKSLEMLKREKQLKQQKKEQRESVRKRFNSGNNLNQSVASNSSGNKKDRESLYQSQRQDRSKSFQQKQQEQFQDLLTFYDQWRMNLHGQILIRKEEKSSFNLLTGIYPYNTEAIKLEIGKTFIFYEAEEFKLNMLNILIKRSPREEFETHILKIPSTQITLQLKWKCKGSSTDHYFLFKDLPETTNKEIEDFQSENLVLYCNFNFPKVKQIAKKEKEEKSSQNMKKKVEKRKDHDFRKIVKDSEVIFFHYQQELVEWIHELPQLRNDIIFLYQVQPPVSPYQKFLQYQQKQDVPCKISETVQQEQTDLLEDSDLGGNGSQFDESFEYNSDFEDEMDEDDSDSEQTQSAQKNEKYTDYITLFKNTINSQLNSKDKRGTFMRHIESIGINAQMQTIRLNVSNRQIQMPDLEKQKQGTSQQSTSQQQNSEKEQQENWRNKTIGIQFVFDSLNFSSAFYLRKCKITGKQLQQGQKIQEVENQLEWGMKSGKGTMDFVYAGVFKLDAELLSLGLPIFQAQLIEKEKTASQSFMSFFHLKSIELGDKRWLFDLDQVLEKYQPKQQLLIKKESQQNECPAIPDELNPILSEQNLEQPELEEAKPHPSKSFFRQKQSKKLGEELNFDIKGVFFKTDEMVYFQNVEQELPKLSRVIQDLNEEFEFEEANKKSQNQNFSSEPQDFTSSHHEANQNLPEKTEKIMVKHYFTFGGCKLLVTTYLVKLIQNIFWRKETNKKNIEKKMEQLQRKQALEAKKLQKKKTQQQIQKSSSKMKKQRSENKSPKKTTSSSINKESSASNNQNNQNKTSESQDFKALYGNMKMRRLFSKHKSVKHDLKQLGLAINVKKPQFNLQYLEKNNQLIIGSQNECYMMWRTNYLPYDKFKLDPQKQMILYFNSFACYTIPQHLDLSHRVYWNDSNSKQPLYNQPVEIIQANDASLTVTNYELEKCELDFFNNYEDGIQKQTYDVGDIFSKTQSNNSTSSNNNNNSKQQTSSKKKVDQEFHWGNYKRAKNLQLSVDNLLSSMNSYDFKTFQLTLEFVGVLVSSEEKEKDYLRQMQKQQRELQLQGNQRICQHILNKFPEYKTKKQQLYYLVQYKLKKGQLEMLDPKGRTFLELNLENLNSETGYYKNKLNKFEISIDGINLDNIQEKNEEFRHIIKYSKKEPSDQPIIKIYKEYYQLPGVTTDTQWTLYDVYQVYMPPLNIKLTEDIYPPFYDYFFKKDTKEEDEESSKKDSQIKTQESETPSEEKEEQVQIDFPFYYGNVSIKDLKFCIHFQSESSLKRLQGVTVIIEPYTVQQQFWTTQALFDDFSYYVKKQVLSQGFSLIKQKLFGGLDTIQDQKKEKDKKKKK